MHNVLRPRAFLLNSPGLILYFPLIPVISFRLMIDSIKRKRLLLLRAKPYRTPPCQDSKIKKIPTLTAQSFTFDIMSNRPPFPYSSSEEVLPYIIKHRFQMTLAEMTNLCAWALDQDSDGRAAILNLVRSPHYIEPNSLGSDPNDQNCSICLEKYGIVLESDTPAQLACGHIMGAECLKKWPIRSESCPHCRSRVFTRRDQPDDFRNGRNLLRDIPIARTDFLGETRWNFNQSYFAFYHWASGTVSSDQINASRQLAVDCMTRLET